jgi:hypothetical protein
MRVRLSGPISQFKQCNPVKTTTCGTCSHKRTVDAIDAGPCEVVWNQLVLAIRHDGTLDILRPGPFGLDRLSGLGQLRAWLTEDRRRRVNYDPLLAGKTGTFERERGRTGNS